MVLDKIEHWAGESQGPPVYWLNGVLGTGKSTIARTIVRDMAKTDKPWASFFCSREEKNLGNPKLIFPTLASQLALKNPSFRFHFDEAIELHTGIAQWPLEFQLKTLILDPLLESGLLNTVIVIDAVEEIQEETFYSQILSVLNVFISDIRKINLKFFITGRPEQLISNGFSQFGRNIIMFSLHEDGRDQAKADIRLFFEHEFSKLKQEGKILGDWPTPQNLDLLNGHASGLFVYAEAIISFVACESGKPTNRLDTLLRSPERSILETRLMGNKTILSIYTTILQNSFDVNPHTREEQRSVLAAVALARNPISPTTIAILLGLEVGSMRLRLSGFQSLLGAQKDSDVPVKPFHPFFLPFLIDETLCINQKFYLSPLFYHKQLLLACLELMNKKLKEDMSELPDVISDSVDAKTKQGINALKYACTSWYKHLDCLAGKMQEVEVVEIKQDLVKFMEKFQFWRRAISRLGDAHDQVVDVGGRLEKWKK